MISLHAEIASTFAHRHQAIVQAILNEFGPLTTRIQSNAAADALRLLDEDLGVLIDLLQDHASAPGDLLDSLCELLRIFSPYFDLRGLFIEQLTWAQGLLGYFQRQANDDDASIDLSLILIIANMMHRLGEHADAIELYQFVLSIDRHRATHPGFAVAYHNMARVYRSVGATEAGRTACQRSLEIDMVNENERGIAANLMLRADFEEADGKMSEAIESMKQAAAIVEAANSPVLTLTYKSQLAALTAKYGSEDTADALYQETLAGWQALGDSEQFALQQFNYAVMKYAVGQSDEAIRLAQASLALLEVDGHYTVSHIRESIAAWRQGEYGPSSTSSAEDKPRYVHWDR